MDQPPRRLSFRRRRHGTGSAWLRLFWLWDVYFAVAYVFMIVLVLVIEDLFIHHVAVIASLTGIAVCYVTFGRRCITTEPDPPAGQGRLFAACVLLLHLVARAFSDAASFSLFAVYPLVFMSLRLREAIAVVVLLNAVPLAWEAVRDGVDEVFPGALPIAALTVGFSVLLGVWITRVIEQSEERANLIRELEESRAEVSRLSHEAGVNAERGRLAAEIHDTLAQGFTSLLTLVQAAESELDRDRDKVRRHLDLAVRTARDNLREARALVAGLTPVALGTGSLEDAIRRQTDVLAEQTGVSATYHADGALVELPTAVEVVLLRTVQEALTNVRKHAAAATVSVSLRCTESAVLLRVADDGAGFDPQRPADDAAFGLRGMRTRAEQVGGTVSIHSGPGAGTVVELEVPR